MSEILKEATFRGALRQRREEIQKLLERLRIVCNMISIVPLLSRMPPQLEHAAYQMANGYLLDVDGVEPLDIPSSEPTTDSTIDDTDDSDTDEEPSVFSEVAGAALVYMLHTPAFSLGRKLDESEQLDVQFCFHEMCRMMVYLDLVDSRGVGDDEVCLRALCSFLQGRMAVFLFLCLPQISPRQLHEVAAVKRLRRACALVCWDAGMKTLCNIGVIHNPVAEDILAKFVLECAVHLNETASPSNKLRTQNMITLCNIRTIELHIHRQQDPAARQELLERRNNLVERVKQSNEQGNEQSNEQSNERSNGDEVVLDQTDTALQRKPYLWDELLAHQTFCQQVLHDPPCYTSCMSIDNFESKPVSARSYGSDCMPKQPASASKIPPVSLQPEDLLFRRTAARDYYPQF